MDVFETAKTVGLKETANSVLGIRIFANGTMPCPIHNEKHGKSFSVRENRLWKCFGKCGKGGDNIELVSVMNGISRYEAAKLICDNLGLAYDAKTTTSTAPAIDYTFLLGNDVIVDFGRLCLLSSVPVLDYLKVKRGFSDKTIEDYQFGFIDADNYAKMYAYVSAGRMSQANYDAFKRHVGRLSIPLFNSSGKQVLGFVSRALSSSDPLKYVNDDDSAEQHGYHKRVYTFGMSQSNKKCAVAIVEGYLDAPSFRQLGVNAVAMGDCSLPEPRFKYLVDMYSTLILGLDNDVTGVFRTLEVVKKFSSINFNFVLWPKDIKDANDALLKGIIPNYGDYFEYVLNVWNNDINDIRTDYGKRMDFIARLRESLSFVSYGSENYFVRKEIDRKIEELLDY